MRAADRSPEDGRLGLLVTLVLIATITSIVSSLGAPLVPSIAAEYGTTVATAQWSLSAALLTGAVATPVIGRVGNGSRRRPTVIAGLSVVLLGCLIAAAAPVLPLLLAGRALQGTGMALIPLALAVARDNLPPARLPAALSLISVATVAGAGLGYPLTGLVSQVVGLPAAFLAGAALALGSLVMAWRELPVVRTEGGAPTDWLGALLLTAGLLAVLVPITQGSAWGWGSAATLLPLVLGTGTIAVAARVMLDRQHPLVDLRLGARPGLVVPNAVALIAGIGMYTLLSLVVVIVRSREPDFGLGLSALAAGLMMLPFAAGSLVAARGALRLLGSSGRRLILPLGCMIALLGSLVLGLLHGEIGWIVVAMALGGLGNGLLFTSLAALMAPHIPAPETAPAMALNQVLRYLGFTLGSAVSVTLFTAFGGGTDGIRWTLVTMSVVWTLACAVSLLDRPALDVDSSPRDFPEPPNI